MGLEGSLLRLKDEVFTEQITGQLVTVVSGGINRVFPSHNHWVTPIPCGSFGRLGRTHFLHRFPDLAIVGDEDIEGDQAAIA